MDRPVDQALQRPCPDAGLMLQTLPRAAAAADAAASKPLPRAAVEVEAAEACSTRSSRHQWCWYQPHRRYLLGTRHRFSQSKPCNAARSTAAPVVNHEEVQRSNVRISVWLPQDIHDAHPRCTTDRCYPRNSFEADPVLSACCSWRVPMEGSATYACCRTVQRVKQAEQELEPQHTRMHMRLDACDNVRTLLRLQLAVIRPTSCMSYVRKPHANRTSCNMI